jgi:hypothetical protein
MTTPGRRIQQSGERSYNEDRAAKKDVQLEKDAGLAASRRGQALICGYRRELKEHTATDKTYGRRDREVYGWVKDEDDLEDRLLSAGIAVAASDALGVNNKREKNSRDVALYIGRALGQPDTDRQWKCGLWGMDMLRQVQGLFYLDEKDVLRIRYSGEAKDLCAAAIRSAAANPYCQVISHQSRDRCLAPRR